MLVNLNEGKVRIAEEQSFVSRYFQTALHDCGLLTSVSLACIWLRTSRPRASHFCTGVAGFLLHLSVSLSLLLEGMEEETPDHLGIFTASQILGLGDG